MSSSSYASQISVGDEVYGSDGDKVGTVAEDNHRRLRLVRQRRETAAQRRAGAALPLGTGNRRGRRLQVVRAGDDHDHVDSTARLHTLEGEREKLLRMEERLGQRVIGQVDAVQAVSNAVRRNRAGLGDPNRLDAPAASTTTQTPVSDTETRV